jgi:alpha-1,6-mannosyltransferase
VTAARARTGAAPVRRHLVDATMFWAPTSGGVRRYLLAKRAHLARRGRWQQSIVTPVTATGDEAAVVAAPPLPFSHGYRVPVGRAAAARAIATLRPDIIEVGDPYLFAWAAFDVRAHEGTPVVAFAHHEPARLVAPLGRFASDLARRYVRRVYDRCDLVLAPSAHAADALARHGVARVAVQPLGVDTTTFHPARRSAVWRARLGIPPGMVAFVYAGRFSPEKHLDVLARAVAQVPMAVLVAIGAGPRPPRGENVIVRPFMQDPLDLAGAIASCDAFVHAGDQETFGLAALEAFACGLPVIARNAAGLAELVDDAVGLAVERDDARAFAVAMNEMMDADRAALGRAARRRALDYEWSAVLDGLVGRYETLVGAPRRRETYADHASPRALPEA